MIYRHIRDLREDNNLTQKALASQLNMSQTGYSKYETGRCDIPTRVLIELSDYYNVSVDYLLDLTDIKCRAKRKKLRLGDK